MILNILMMILLFILTLYEIISINIIYMFWSDLTKHLTDWFFIILVYWIFILWAYLIYVLFHWLYIKTLHKNYWYTYWIFFIVLIIFYFWYYIQYDKEPLIPESTFETKLYNIEVKPEENWLIQLWNVLKNNELAKTTLQDVDKKTNKIYTCITENSIKKCEETDLNDAIEYYKTNKNDIDLLNWEISKIIKYKYFKGDYSGNFPELWWLSSLARTSLFSTIYELQLWNQEKALNTILTYKKLWDKLLDWDNSFIWIIVWLELENITDRNINYILGNYEFDKENLNTLKNELSNPYDWIEIMTNVIKMEYHMNKSGFKSWVDDWFIRSSLLFDMDEFFNEMRRQKLAMINWEEDMNKLYTNYFKRRYLYKFLLWFSTFSVEAYKKDFDDLNSERKKVVEKIDEKLSNKK